MHEQQLRLSPPHVSCRLLASCSVDLKTWSKNSRTRLAIVRRADDEVRHLCLKSERFVDAPPLAALPFTPVLLDVGSEVKWRIWGLIRLIHPRMSSRRMFPCGFDHRLGLDRSRCGQLEGWDLCYLQAIVHKSLKKLPASRVNYLRTRCHRSISQFCRSSTVLYSTHERIW